MKKAASLLVLALGLTIPVSAQRDTEGDLRELLPYSEAKRLVPGLTYENYNAIMRQMAVGGSRSSRPASSLRTFDSPAAPKSEPAYLGRLGGNRFSPDSTSNPYGAGSRYAPNGVKNPYSPYGNPYSPSSVTNPYATQTPRLYGQDGKYLGKLSNNPFDPESVSNPYGRYGNRYSPDSINNPYGTYGSPYSPLSPRNPYSTRTPLIIDPEK